MTQPPASRPYLPGYGIRPADQGTGLLPWSWAVERLTASRHYWVSTVWPDGRPHTMPVWAVWDGSTVWFSSGLRSRKVRNIEAGSAVVVCTQDPHNPVVVEGAGRIVTDAEALGRFLDAMNVKYHTDYSIEFMDPTRTALVSVRPAWAFGVTESDFEGSPTRWAFPP
jgi:PPOX class probable F420-dependent enzyme